MRNPLDLTNKRSGSLVAIKPTDKKEGNYIIWECKCDCGKTAYVSSSKFNRKVKVSCGVGCITKIKNLVGQKFGRLTVISLHPERAKKQTTRWISQCDCGNTKIVTGKNLTSKNVKSCGCLHIERPNTLRGENHPFWKGGYLNKGSESWAEGKIARINNHSVKNGYSKIENFTSQDLINLLKESNGKCQICGKQEGTSQYELNHLDHCHKTGKVRGFLCPQCNTGIGNFKDSSEILQKAIEYLQKTVIKQEECLTA